MTKLQKQKHITEIIKVIKEIEGIEETRFGNYKLKEKDVCFFLKDNNLRIERKGINIFSKPWVRITLDDITKVINKITT